MNNKLILILILQATLPIFAMEEGAAHLKLTYADNQKDEFLFKAVVTKDLYSVKQALAQGAQIEARCTSHLDKGKTPLAFACYFGTPLIAQHLMSLGADCNACDDKGLPPLYHALQGIYTPQCVPLVEALVQNGADVGLQKNKIEYTHIPEGVTPIHRIAQIMQNTRFGNREHESFDIGTAPEVFKRIELILTIIVKEFIKQAYREKKQHSWQSRLKELFAKTDANGKAAYQLFEKYQQFKMLEESPYLASEMPNLELHDLLEYKLFKLLHPNLVCIYQFDPYFLEQNVRKEQVLLDN